MVHVQAPLLEQRLAWPPVSKHLQELVWRLTCLHVFCLSSGDARHRKLLPESSFRSTGYGQQRVGDVYLWQQHALAATFGGCVCVAAYEGSGGLSAPSALHDFSWTGPAPTIWGLAWYTQQMLLSMLRLWGLLQVAVGVSVWLLH